MRLIAASAQTGTGCTSIHMLLEWPRAALCCGQQPAHPRSTRLHAGRTQAGSALCLLAPCQAANREKHLQRGSEVQFLSTNILKPASWRLNPLQWKIQVRNVLLVWGAAVGIGQALQAWPWAQIFSGQPVPRYCTALCTLLTPARMKHLLNKKGIPNE